MSFYKIIYLLNSFIFSFVDFIVNEFFVVSMDERKRGIKFLFYFYHFIGMCVNGFSFYCIFFIFLQLILLISVSPFVSGTFFPFSLRSSFLSPRYRSRQSRSSPTNLFQLQSPILGLPFTVPRAFMDLLGIRCAK